MLSIFCSFYGAESVPGLKRWVPFIPDKRGGKGRGGETLGGDMGLGRREGGSWVGRVRLGKRGGGMKMLMKKMVMEVIVRGRQAIQYYTTIRNIVS